MGSKDKHTVPIAMAALHSLIPGFIAAPSGTWSSLQKCIQVFKPDYTKMYTIKIITVLPEWQ
jgi:hypothetical protein